MAYCTRAVGHKPYQKINKITVVKLTVVVNLRLKISEGLRLLIYTHYFLFWTYAIISSRGMLLIPIDSSLLINNVKSMLCICLKKQIF